MTKAATPKRGKARVSDQAIVAGALRVIRRQGPGFSLADIGRAVGLSAPRLVQRFGSRRRLLQLVLDHWSAVGLEALETLTKASRPIEAYASWSRAGYHALTRHQATDSIAWILIVGGDPVLKRWYRRHLERVHLALAGLLKAGVAAGELRPHDTRESARSLLVSLTGQTALLGVGYPADGEVGWNWAMEAALAPYRAQRALRPDQSAGWMKSGSRAVPDAMG